MKTMGSVLAGRAGPPRDGRRRLRAAIVTRVRWASASAGFGEPWVTKRQLAAHLGVTPRFIELQQHLGLPYMRLGTANRYKISEVESWLRGHYPTAAETVRG